MSKTTVEKVASRLDQYRVDYGEWGTGKDNSYSLQKLVNEIESGEASLVEVDGELVREIKGAGVAVYFRDGDRLFKLKEGKRTLPDGRVLDPRDFPGSIGEKRQPGEDAVTNAVRALSEELGIEGAEVRFDHQFDIVRPSKQYPGLQTRYRTDFFVCYLTSAQFSRDGYEERQPDKTTEFRWTEVSAEDHHQYHPNKGRLDPR